MTDHRRLRAECIAPFAFAAEGTSRDMPHLASLRESAYAAVRREDEALKAAGYMLIKRDADNGAQSCGG